MRSWFPLHLALALIEQVKFFNSKWATNPDDATNYKGNFRKRSLVKESRLRRLKKDKTEAKDYAL
jgi:hypothetical protein